MKKKIIKATVSTGIPGITQDFIDNLTKFVHKYSPDRKSKKPTKWDQEEVKEYVKMALDEIMLHENIMYAIIDKVCRFAYFTVAVNFVDNDGKSKKFQRKANYCDKKYQVISKKLGHPNTQLKVK